MKPGSSNFGFILGMDDSKEWADFDLTLRVLKEMGAQPLILSVPEWPNPGCNGVTWQARQEYYFKLQNAVSPYGFPSLICQSGWKSLFQH